MRFLCLHGSLTSADVFSAQLGPLQQILAADNTASFYYLNAPLSATAPPEQLEYFGPPPHYRWLDYSGVDNETLYASMRGAQINPHAASEESLRSLIPRDLRWTNYQNLMGYVEKTLEKNPDIEGLVGYSEGSAIAAAYILREQKREQETSRTRQIKCAVFFTGFPPVNSEGGFILADEREEMIELPTVHVVGANDPYRVGADCLYNICDPDTAHFFDTGKGHTIPRGGPVIEELGEALRQLIRKTKGG